MSHAAPAAEEERLRDVDRQMKEEMAEFLLEIAAKQEDLAQLQQAQVRHTQPLWPVRNHA